MSTEALVNVQDVTKEYTIRRSLQRMTVRALDGVSLTLAGDRPEVLAIVGESGSGKSTLARLVLGLDSPTQGSVTVLGKQPARLSRAQRQAWLYRIVQPVFQDPFSTFNPRRRVRDYLLFTATYLHPDYDRHDVLTLIEKQLQIVGLSMDDIWNRYPTELSGGQLQRIAIARALLATPRLLVADEPVSMLDASLRMSIINLFETLKANVTIIYITHDLATAYYIADYILVMMRGWVVEAGPVDEVLEHPKHPYTNLLKAAVLEPDPAIRNRLAHIGKYQEVNNQRLFGCKFADRCPFAMPVCQTEIPPLIRVGNRSVKCHLSQQGRTE